MSKDSISPEEFEFFLKTQADIKEGTELYHTKAGKELYDNSHRAVMDWIEKCIEEGKFTRKEWEKVNAELQETSRKKHLRRCRLN